MRRRGADLAEGLLEAAHVRPAHQVVVRVAALGRQRVGMTHLPLHPDRVGLGRARRRRRAEHAAALRRAAAGRLVLQEGDPLHLQPVRQKVGRLVLARLGARGGRRRRTATSRAERRRLLGVAAPASRLVARPLPVAVAVAVLHDELVQLEVLVEPHAHELLQQLLDRHRRLVRHARPRARGRELLELPLRRHRQLPPVALVVGVVRAEHRLGHRLRRERQHRRLRE